MDELTDEGSTTPIFMEIAEQRRLAAINAALTALGECTIDDLLEGAGRIERYLGEGI